MCPRGQRLADTTASLPAPLACQCFNSRLLVSFFLFFLSPLMASPPSALGGVPEGKYLPEGTCTLTWCPGGISRVLVCAVVAQVAPGVPGSWGRDNGSISSWQALPPRLLTHPTPVTPRKRPVRLSTSFGQKLGGQREGVGGEWRGVPGGGEAAYKCREQGNGYQRWHRAWVKWVKGIKRHTFPVVT